MEQQVTENKKEETKDISPNLVMTPGKMRVIKRNGKVVSFEDEKITLFFTEKSEKNQTLFENFFCKIMV